jgi:uncharacterized protein (TIGR02145 family)
MKKVKLSIGLIKMIIISQFLLVLICHEVKAQTVNYGDLVRLKVTTSYRGIIIWQKSLDSITWSDIPGATKDSLDVTVTSAIYFQAKITEGTCQPVYSNVRYISTKSCSCQGIDSVIFESQTYHTVKIGNQCWLKENLNAGTMISKTSAPANNAVTEKYCYNDIASNCNIYGGLYRWDEMMNYVSSSNTNPSGVKGICPTGWHIPSDLEWSQLITLTHGNPGGDLKESGTAHWESTQAQTTNASGFSALPGGYYSPTGTTNYDMLFKHALFWTTTDQNSTSAYKRKFASIWYDTFEKNPNSKTFGLSVRCIKD